MYALEFLMVGGILLWFCTVLLNLAVLLRVVLGGGSPMVYFGLLFAVVLVCGWWLPYWVPLTILTTGWCVGWWNVKGWALLATMLSWTLTLLAIALVFAGWFVCCAIIGWISFALAVWGVVVREQIDAAMRRLTRNPSPETTADVVQLGPSAIGALRQVLHGIERGARLAAVAALGQIGTHEARAELQFALEHRDPEMRNAAEAWLNTPNTIVWHGQRAS